MLAKFLTKYCISAIILSRIFLILYYTRHSPRIQKVSRVSRVHIFYETWEGPGINIPEQCVKPAISLAMLYVNVVVSHVDDSTRVMVCSGF